MDITEFGMMKGKSPFYMKDKGDRMLDFIFDVIYCFISDV